jgi:two-component system NtrC family response regulator
MVSKSKRKKNNILLVDDDPHILDLYYQILLDEGYYLTKATSGERAIEVMLGNHFDMVVTDLNMGQVDGISVLRKAKELDPKTIVIITTANTDIHYAIKALRFHADDYMLKPFDLQEFLIHISRCLN